MSAPVILPGRHTVVIDYTWIAVFALIAVDALWMWSAGIRFVPRTLIIVFGASALLSLLSFVYRYVRRDDPIWFSLQLVNQLILGSFALAVFSYLALRLDFPLMDTRFIAMDERLGFDWLAYIGWAEHHPAIARIFTLCYGLTEPEILLILILLSFFKRFVQVHRFALGYLLGGMVTVFTSALWPALPAYVYRGIGAAAYPHLQVAAASSYRDEFFAMRDHVMHTLPEMLQGVIAFPSFHSVLAVLAMVAAMAIPVLILRVGIITLNVLMLLSTPVDGGHYLVDTLSGIVLGLAVAACVARWVPDEKT